MKGICTMNQQEIFTQIEKELGSEKKVVLSPSLSAIVESNGSQFKLEALMHKDWIIGIKNHYAYVSVITRTPRNFNEKPIQTATPVVSEEPVKVRYSTAKKVKDFKACQKLADDIMATLPEHQRVKEGLPSERLYKMFKAMKEF